MQADKTERDPRIATLINEHCELAENPLWRPEDGCLYWTDITGGKVHRFHPGTREHTVIYHGERVGGFTFQTDGSLLLFRVKDLATLRADGRVSTLREFADAGAERFNDVIADPEGRVFAGTIGTTPESGGLFLIERDGAITSLFRGTGCSNGMGFSPDLKSLYWTCSTRRRIYAFDYDRATGGISRQRVLYQADESEGIPDGMTVDANGHIWSARWDGFAIVHHAPDGSVVERIPFPVAEVSSLCFGGPQLDQFFVTTAGGQAGASTEDGAIFQMPAGVRGHPGFKSRIRCSN